MQGLHEAPECSGQKTGLQAPCQWDLMPQGWASLWSLATSMLALRQGVLQPCSCIAAQTDTVQQERFCNRTGAATGTMLRTLAALWPHQTHPHSCLGRRPQITPVCSRTSLVGWMAPAVNAQITEASKPVDAFSSQIRADTDRHI